MAEIEQAMLLMQLLLEFQSWVNTAAGPKLSVCLSEDNPFGPLGCYNGFTVLYVCGESVISYNLENDVSIFAFLLYFFPCFAFYSFSLLFSLSVNPFLCYG